MLSKKEMEEIFQKQIKIQEKMKSTSEAGTKINFAGKKIIITKNVFWPGDDTELFVKLFTVHPGESVLDVCTGSGVIAVFAAYKGAKKIVATDINPDAVKCAKDNAKFHGFSDIIDVRLSDMFGSVEDYEKFDVITVNLPFMNRRAPDVVASSVWDTDLCAHKKFFSDAGKYLKQKGRIYLCHANFGAINEMKRMTKDAGFSIKSIGKKEFADTPKIYYMFELTKK